MQFFLLAESNNQVFKKKFLEFRELMPDVTTAEFYALFEAHDDGTTRLKEENYTGRRHKDGWISKHATGFVGKNAPIQSQEFKNRLMLGYKLVDQFGAAWTNVFANISMPENVTIVYWPGYSWGLDLTADVDLTQEEWVTVANFKNNPQRESVWTGVFYEETSDTWMVSAETPVDVGNQNLINIGHDILLNTLFDRVLSDHLAGTYNFIFREDGRLIAHPDKIVELKAALGVLKIQDINNTELLDMYNFISEHNQVNSGKISNITHKDKGFLDTLNLLDFFMKQPVIESNHHEIMVLDNKQHDVLLAVAKIQGQDWFFVTVYPKTLLESSARETVKFIVILSLSALFLELMMLYFVLKSKVVQPLKSFMNASNEVAMGNYIAVAKDDSGLPITSLDEMGMLARAFQNMAINVNDLRENLEQKVHERTHELEIASEKAKNASKAKSDFLARMSHEIRTPMNAIMGLSRLVLNSKLNAKQTDYMEKIIASSESLLGIINDILDYSKIEAGKLTIETRAFDLNDVLKNVSTVIALKAQIKGLEFLFQIDKDVPRILKGDALRLGQVLINLANNAVKFTETGDILIHIEKVSTIEDGIILRFIVKDTGIGISKAQQQELFSPFSQADGSITRRFGGTGLGLAICKQITGLMHGEIYIESEVGVGSSFIFTAKLGIGENIAQFSLDKLKNIRVLVVDDNASAREVFNQMLLDFGMRPSIAENGLIALSKLKQAEAEHDCYELILLDWNMPRLDGIETVRHLRKKIILKIFLRY